MTESNENKPVFLAIKRIDCATVEFSPSKKDNGDYLVVVVTPAKGWDAAEPLGGMFRRVTRESGTGEKGPNYTTITPPTITKGNEFIPALIMKEDQLKLCEQGADVRRVDNLNTLVSEMSRLMVTGTHAAGIPEPVAGVVER